MARRLEGWLNVLLGPMSSSMPPPRRSASRTRLRRLSSADRMIAQASELLGEANDAERVLGAIARLVVPRLGDHCVIDAVNDEGNLVRVAEAAADPTIQALLQDLRRFSVSNQYGSPAMEVLRTGAPVVIEQVGRSTLEDLCPDPEYRALVAKVGATSSISVPATAHGRVVAVITFGMDRSGRVHAPEDVEFAERLARQAALALDSQRLYEAERKARAEAERTAARLARLARLTAALAEALTPAQVAEAVLRHGIPALGAAAGCVGVVREHERVLEMLAFEGYSDQVQREWQRVSLDARIPLTVAVETGKPVLVESREYWGQDDPMAFRDRAETRAIVALPLVVHGKVLGAISFSLDDPRGVTDADRPLMGTLADQCGQALDRAQLYAAEREARQEVEIAHERLLLLADAQQRFVQETDDLQRVLEVVARYVAEAMGDTCRVRLLPDGDWWPDVPQTYSSAPGTDPQVGHAILSTDLVVRGRALGILELVRRPGGRTFNDSDRVLLEQLAQRAAVAVAKARSRTAERAARAEAERALVLRDELLAVVSHDLRTPLGTVNMAASLLEEDMPPDHPFRPQVGAIQRAVAAMDRLIEDLVDMARLEGGQLMLDCRAEPVRELVLEVSELMGPQARARGLRLDVHDQSDGARVVCDHRRVLQILGNLLANAVKFTPDQGHIELGARREARGVELWVRNSGPGLTDTARQRMFDRFWTMAPEGSAHGTGKKGLGLGLTIVRGLVEAHGSHVEVESAPEEGTTVRFRLPLASGC
jgi:signal transduction histidine kinase